MTIKAKVRKPESHSNGTTLQNNTAQPQEFSTVNLYQYCSMYWHMNQVRPVQFYGYYNKPTWPLNESFSKWTLTLYKPWHKDIDELKAIDGTFKTSLEQYMYDPMFPSRLLSEILRVKIQQKPVDIEEGENFMIKEHGTPTSQRENDNFEEHAIAAMSPNDETEIEDDLDLGMTENLFNLLQNRAPPVGVCRPFYYFYTHVHSKYIFTYLL